MLDKSDIKKLSGIFLTKADSKKFATKTDLKKFATKADLQKFATKTDGRACRLEENGREVKEITMRIAEKVSGHEEQLNRLEENSQHIREIVEGMATGIDAIAGGLSDLRMEYVAITLQQNRHEERIVRLEQKTGVALSA